MPESRNIERMLSTRNCSNLGRFLPLRASSSGWKTMVTESEEISRVSGGGGVEWESELESVG